MNIHPEGKRLSLIEQDNRVIKEPYTNDEVNSEIPARK